MSIMRCGLIAILLLYTIAVSSQEKISGIQFNQHYGKIVPHHDNLQKLESFYNMYDIRLFWRTKGDNWWDAVYNYPLYGLGFSYTDIKNKKVGKPFNIYSFIDFPLTRPGRLIWGIEFDLGISLGYKGFNPENNPENRAISSDINCYVSVALPLRYSFNSKIDLYVSPALYHSSNGGSKVPNTGLNMLGGRCGMLYYFKEKQKFIIQELPVIDRRKYIDIYAASGYVDNESDYSNTKYLTSTFSFGFSRRVGYKSKIGIGTDFFYNAANKVKFTNDFKKEYLLQNAVFISHELLYRNIGILTQLGAYTYTKYTPTERIYERVGVRWYMSKALFTGVAVKAHLFNAEFLEWSIGYSIPI